MTSKEHILAALRNSDAAPYPMPDLSGLEAAAIRYDDPEAEFRKAVAGAGGVVADSLPCDDEDSFTVRGAFGVAENGCIWIADGSFPDRKDLFAHQRLIIRLDRKELVNNMHQAYSSLGEAPLSYGVFICGPSKTADIEQALVLGAHGPRSLVVVLE